VQEYKEKITFYSYQKLSIAMYKQFFNPGVELGIILGVLFLIAAPTSLVVFSLFSYILVSRFTSSSPKKDSILLKAWKFITVYQFWEIIQDTANYVSEIWFPSAKVVEDCGLTTTIDFGDFK
jgi:uncharacterized membrane protein YobD (UPF0266 family)